jgi:tetratricopeptide (TPR) repeat protein
MTRRELFEDSPRGRRLRQRAAALAAVFVFLNGVVVAIGLGSLLPVLFGALGLTGLTAATAWAIYRHRLWAHLPRARSDAAVGTVLPSLKPKAKLAATFLSARLSNPNNATIPDRADDWRGWPYAGSWEANARPVLQVEHGVDEPRRRARELNSLALALVAEGATDAAVERFEESLEILRELEDEGDEARVIANLGFALLKQGADERACVLLAQALEKLPPESPAAQRVEAQLRRAS